MVAGTNKTVVSFDQKALRALDHLTRAIESANRFEAALLAKKTHEADAALEKVRYSLEEDGYSPEEASHIVSTLLADGIVFRLKES